MSQVTLDQPTRSMLEHVAFSFSGKTAHVSPPLIAFIIYYLVKYVFVVTVTRPVTGTSVSASRLVVVSFSDIKGRWCTMGSVVDWYLIVFVLTLGKLDERSLLTVLALVLFNWITLLNELIIWTYLSSYILYYSANSLPCIVFSFRWKPRIRDENFAINFFRTAVMILLESLYYFCHFIRF